MHQDGSGGDGGRIQENDLGKILGGFEREFVDQTDADGFVSFIVENHGVDDGVRAQSHFPGHFRSFEGGRLAAEIGTEGTTAHAQVPIEAGRPTQRELLRGGCR